jgi:hypothetical protein
MSTSEAIRKLAKNGLRIYPLPCKSGFKLAIENGNDPVGERIKGNQRIINKIYNADEINTKQKLLIHKMAKKIKDKIK